MTVEGFERAAPAYGGSLGRIAMISEHASPLGVLGGADGGGQNVYVAQIARRLAIRGYEVDIFTRRESPSQPRSVEWAPRCRVIHVPAGPPRVIRKEDLLPHMGEFSAWTRRFFEAQRRPYDLVHANFFMSGLVAAELQRSLGVPFVVTFHALGRVRRKYQGEDDGFPNARFAIEDRVVREADRIIAECTQDERDLVELYHADPARIVTIPCGFDADECRPVDQVMARKRLGLPRNVPIVLHLTRMVPRKGVADGIRAFARLRRDHGVEALLVIVGGETDVPDPVATPEIGRLQRVAEDEGVADSVLFMGRCDRSSLKYYYSAADVFVTTPWYEPFGITPVEAMACGTPVIGARVGGIQDTVVDGETGYLVPPRDAEALAERLAELLRNPAKARRFGENAIRRAHEHYLWSNVARQVADLYADVVRRPVEVPQPVEADVAGRRVGA